MSSLKAVCADKYYLPKEYDPEKHVFLKEKFESLSKIKKKSKQKNIRFSK